MQGAVWTPSGEWCPYGRHLRARTRLRWSVMTARRVAAWIVQGSCRAWLLVQANAPTSVLIQQLVEPAECLASAVTNKSMAASRAPTCSPTHLSRCLSVHRRSELHCSCIWRALWTMHMCRSDGCSCRVRSVPVSARGTLSLSACRMHTRRALGRYG